VWSVVEEDLCLATNDLEHGICLEEGFYDNMGNYVKDGIYELATWGDFSIQNTGPNTGEQLFT
jgi:hypothetical protein